MTQLGLAFYTFNNCSPEVVTASPRNSLDILSSPQAKVKAEISKLELPPEWLIIFLLCNFHQVPLLHHTVFNTSIARP